MSTASNTNTTQTTDIYQKGLHYNQILLSLSYVQWDVDEIQEVDPRALYGFFTNDPERVAHIIFGINYTKSIILD